VWGGLRARSGAADGTRQLCDVLMLLRKAPGEIVTMAVELALSYGCVDAAAVTTMLRQLQAPATEESAPLVGIGSLLAYERPEPDITRYDAWLGREVH
jgi:hypothetical protein